MAARRSPDHSPTTPNGAATCGPRRQGTDLAAPRSPRRTPTSAPPVGHPLGDDGPPKPPTPPPILTRAAPHHRPRGVAGATGTDDTDLRTTGDTQIRAAETRHQRALSKRAAAVTRRPRTPATQRWANAAKRSNRASSRTPTGRHLAGRLAAAARAGIDIDQRRHRRRRRRAAARRTARCGAVVAALPATSAPAAVHRRRRCTPPPPPCAANGPPSSPTYSARSDRRRSSPTPHGPASVAAVSTPATAGGPASWPVHRLRAAHGGQDHAPVAGHEMPPHSPGGSPCSPKPTPPPHHRRPARRAGTAASSDQDGDDNARRTPRPRPDRDPERLPRPATPSKTTQWLESVDWRHRTPSSPRRTRSGSAHDLDTTAYAALTPARTRQHRRRPRHQPPRPDGTAQNEDPRMGPPVTPARIADLNEQALAFFTDHYRDSWAAHYLTERLGSDLVDDERFHPGYAPAGWTNLTDHLANRRSPTKSCSPPDCHGSQDRGRLIDRFRDRLVLPIYHGERCTASSAAATPPPTTAGPKYLNTADTPLFTKGDQLYGAAEALPRSPPARPQSSSKDRSTPSPSPLRAVGSRKAGNRLRRGRAAAARRSPPSKPSGTIPPHIPILGGGTPGSIVATDTDRASKHAATRAYWRLAARGDNPRRANIVGAKDPPSYSTPVAQQPCTTPPHSAGPAHRSTACWPNESPPTSTASMTSTARSTPAGRPHTCRSAPCTPARLGRRDHCHPRRRRRTARSRHHYVLDAGEAWLEDPARAGSLRLGQRPAPAVHTPLHDQSPGVQALQAKTATAATRSDQQPEEHRTTTGTGRSSPSKTAPASGPATGGTRQTPRRPGRAPHLLPPKPPTVDHLGPEDTAEQLVEPWAELAESIHPGITGATALGSPRRHPYPRERPRLRRRRPTPGTRPTRSPPRPWDQPRPGIPSYPGLPRCSPRRGRRETRPRQLHPQHTR